MSNYYHPLFFILVYYKLHENGIKKNVKGRNEKQTCDKLLSIMFFLFLINNSFLAIFTNSKINALVIHNYVSEEKNYLISPSGACPDFYISR